MLPVKVAQEYVPGNSQFGFYLAIGTGWVF